MKFWSIYHVANILSVERDSDNNKLIVITYENEDVQPTIFYLPKGQDGEIGKDGVGISEFLYEKGIPVE